MPTLTLSCPFEQNQIVISPEEIMETYLFGVPLSGRDGKYLSNDTIKFHINNAISEVESELELKIMPFVTQENKDFWLQDWRAWNYIRTTYPVKVPAMVKGYINDVVQITYPKEWLSSRKTNDGKVYLRNLYMVPTNGAATTNSVVFSGITPHLGFFGNQQIPNYWQLTYVTGFDKIPKDLLGYIGKKAAVNVMSVLDSTLLPLGVQNQSLSIDGLSQSIGSTRSPNGSIFGGRIKEYENQMKEQIKNLRAVYKGFEMTAL